MGGFLMKMISRSQNFRLIGLRCEEWPNTYHRVVTEQHNTNHNEKQTAPRREAPTMSTESDAQRLTVRRRICEQPEGVNDD
jgi:hypothetical protein